MSTAALDDVRAALHALLRTAAQPGLVLHVVLETRSAPVGFRPVAELWAFVCREPAALPAALARAAETGDDGFVFDCLHALPDSPTVVAVDALFPAWPDDFDAGYALLLEALRGTLMGDAGAGLLHAWLSPAGGPRTSLRDAATDPAL